MRDQGAGSRRLAGQTILADGDHLIVVGRTVGDLRIGKDRAGFGRHPPDLGKAAIHQRAQHDKLGRRDRPAARLNCQRQLAVALGGGDGGAVRGLHLYIVARNPDAEGQRRHGDLYRAVFVESRRSTRSSIPRRSNRLLLQRRICGDVAAQAEGSARFGITAVDGNDCRSACILAAKDVEALLVVRQQGIPRTGAQEAVLAAQAAKLLIERQQIGVGLSPVRQTGIAFGIFPRVGLAVVGVIALRVAAKAGETHFVAVVDRGRAGQGELQGRGQGKTSAATGKIIHGLLCAGVYTCLVQHVDGAIDIVRRDQVHGRGEGRRWVVLLDRAQRGVKLAGGQPRNCAVIVGEIAAAQEAEHGGAETVVHAAVELVAQHAQAGIRLLPRFGDEQGVGVGGLGRGAEQFKEVGVDLHHVGHHVDAPAVHARCAQPGRGDTVRPQPVFDYLLVRRVHLRQRGIARPLGIVGVAGAHARTGGARRCKDVPRAVGAGLALARAFCVKAGVAVKERAVG